MSRKREEMFSFEGKNNPNGEKTPNVGKPPMVENPHRGENPQMGENPPSTIMQSSGSEVGLEPGSTEGERQGQKPLLSNYVILCCFGGVRMM